MNQITNAEATTDHSALCLKVGAVCLFIRSACKITTCTLFLCYKPFTSAMDRSVHAFLIREVAFAVKVRRVLYTTSGVRNLARELSVTELCGFCEHFAFNFK